MDENYNGAIPQSPEEAEKNYAFAEIVASANEVIWLEKQKPAGDNYVLGNKFWRKFPTQDQDGSGSCVAQTYAKLLGILSYLRWGIFIRFSAGHIYMRRSNRNIGDGQGMISTDVHKIAQQGVTFEELMPSQKMSESQMNALFESELHKEVKLSIGNYIFLPVGNLEAVASVIQTTKKGVMVWFRFGKGEWTDYPELKVETPTAHHSVAGVDFTKFKNEKSIVIDESWGTTNSIKELDAQRVIRETFYKARNTHASYPMDFKFDSTVVPAPERKAFGAPLVFIELDPVTQRPVNSATHEAQKADVIRLQDILKKEGLLPTNIESTGLYHNLTAKAVKAFQIKYAVAPMAELNEVNGRRVGGKTLAKLNELYG